MITRPSLEVGKSILESLNYYHHQSGDNLNFYLPGYGAYWYGTYPDEQVVTKINGIEWLYSDKKFVEFIEDLEMYSTWKYSGESELLMLEYKNGNLFFDRMISFYLDNMIRDKVIVSIPQFFQQLFRICKNNNGLTEISIILERGKMAQITKEGILECIPARLRKFFTQDYKVLKENDEKIEG